MKKDRVNQWGAKKGGGEVSSPWAGEGGHSPTQLRPGAGGNSNVGTKMGGWGVWGGGGGGGYFWGGGGGGGDWEGTEERKGTPNSRKLAAT